MDKAMLRSTPLEDTNLVGDVHSLVLSAHAHKRLLEAQRRDNSVHLVALDVVQLVDSLADLSLVGTDIHEEGENVLRLTCDWRETNGLPQSSSSKTRSQRAS